MNLINYLIMTMNKEITLEEVKEVLPNKTYLYYVDYRDSFDNSIEEIQQCIHNANLEALDEIMDWDASEEEESYIVELRENLCQKYSKQTVDDFVDKNRDEIVDIIKNKH